MSGLATALLIVLVLEVGLRMAYSIRNAYATAFPFFTIQYDHMPLPPWLNYTLAIQPDRTLFWKYRPNVQRSYVDVFVPVVREEDRTTLIRRFVPTIPLPLTQHPSIDVALNSEGFRERPFRPDKDAGVIRVVCLGDSWTFGWNVPQREAYPQQLQALLDERVEIGQYEVLNLGVGGYTSHQGLELLRSRARSLSPDIVLIGFAMNDALVVGYRDKDVASLRPSLGQLTRRVLELSETYNLVRYLILSSRQRPSSIGDHLGYTAETAGSSEEFWRPGPGVQHANYDDLDPWTRVGPSDYERNIVEMIRIARGQGSAVILLYNQLWDSPYRGTLQRIAAREGVPFIDSQALIVQEKRRLASQLEQDVGLTVSQAAIEQSKTVVFRVYAGHTAVPKAISIVGPDAGLGNMNPNHVTMYDDGTHGDQKAGDDVWSYAVSLKPGRRVFYTYTNSGPHGEWVGLDVPEVREFTWEGATEAQYRPIELFGKLELQADSLHTDGVGYRLIARAIADELRALVPVVAGGRTERKVAQHFKPDTASRKAE